DAIAVQPAGGGEISRVPLGSIVSAEFTSTASSAASRPAQRGRQFRVTLSDGTILSGSAIALGGEELRVTLRDGSTRPLPMSLVAGIEQVDGPVVWLSSLAPIENVQTPYFGDHMQPAQMDRTVAGEPIRAGQHEYTRGTGVHSYSKVQFPRDDRFAAFRTQFPIDGDLGFADVTARIPLDGRRVWEKPAIRAGPPPPPLILDVAGHKTITLEVD